MVDIPKKRQIEILRALGADDPKGHAADGPHGLARYLLLTALWRCVNGEGDAWQAEWAKGTPVGAAIARVLAAGAGASDLSLIVRELQILALFNALQVLDNAAHGIEDLQGKIEENVEWRVAAFDGENEVVGAPLGELHGAFQAMAPRPRRRSKRT